MGWASRYIEALGKGETVKFRPRGNSMKPHIKSGQLVTVVPASVDSVDNGDIVLCKVNGQEFLHFCAVRGIDECRIENASGHVDGFTKKVYGKVTAIED